MLIRSIPLLSLSSLVAVACAQSPFAPPKASMRYAPDRTCDLIHVSVELDVNYEKKSIAGTVTNELSPLRNGLTSIILHAGKGLVIRNVTVNGVKREFIRNENRLEINTGEIKKGQLIKVVVSYSADNAKGTGFGSGGGGWHWILPNAQNASRIGFWTQGESNYNSEWVPTWDYPNDLATSETKTTVPADWNVVGNGALVSSKLSADGKKRTYDWKMSQVHATYLLSLCGGPFDIKKDKWKGVDLWYVVPRGSGYLIDNSFGHTKDMLEFFSNTLGVKYPWPKYAQNAMFDFGGGMENVSATTLGEGSLSEGRDGFFEMDSLNSHELGHQWFGDLVTCKDWGDTWLNESFATFMQMIYFEHSRGNAAYDQEIEDAMRGYFQEARRYKRPLTTKMYPNDDAMFDSHSYPKGGVVLHTLRKYLGDENFFAGLKYYLTKWKHTPVESSQLRRSMTEATGINCEPFWAQWIEKPGHPVLETSWSTGNGKITVKVKQIQDTSDGTPIYNIRANVGVISQGKLTRFPIQISAVEETFEIRFDSKPDAVILDPDHDFLREIKLLSWNESELFPILRFATNATDRAEALKRILSKTISDKDLEEIKSLLQADSGVAPVFLQLNALSNLANPTLKSFWIKQLEHANFARRSVAVLALGKLPADNQTTGLLRSLITEKSPIQVVVNSINTLKSWDAKGNKDIFERAKLITDRRSRIKRAAESALKE